MKGFILAAGLGTRLKPWTDSHPKALVPVGGTPMLQRVVGRMHDAGISDITVNVFHFADQIIDFLQSRYPDIKISDERPELLETGGGLLHAAPLLEGNEPILVHNVDILSNADLRELERFHIAGNADATLLVSNRASSRKLITDARGLLRGWHNETTDEYRPEGFKPEPEFRQLAFSGIYIVSPSLLSEFGRYGFSGRFPIMDFFMRSLAEKRYLTFEQTNLEIIDIGKPDSLNRANIITGK